MQHFLVTKSYFLPQEKIYFPATVFEDEITALDDKNVRKLLKQLLLSRPI